MHAPDIPANQQGPVQLPAQPPGPAAAAAAFGTSGPLELHHWLNYCRHVIPDLLEQHQLEPGPPLPFDLSEPVRSLRLDNGTVWRTRSFTAMIDADAIGNHTQLQQTEQASFTLLSAGFDIHDAPRYWPKNYLIWALRTIDLRDANLRMADLSGADLSGLHLEQVDLRGADLTNCNLTKAVINLCDLRGADLTGATLSEVSISECNLENAILARADLTACRVEYSQFAHSDCTEIYLEGATLEHVDFFEAQLAHANLVNAVVKHCVFEKTEMMAAELTRASICETNFRSAVMTRALIRNADVHNCDLRRANLDTADTTDTQFLNTRLEDATFKVLPSSCKTIVYSYHNPGYGEASSEEEAYKTIDSASYDYNLSGLRKKQQPNGIALDDDLMISKYQLPIDIDRKLRAQFNAHFAACDSDSEGSYLDDISDSDPDSDEDDDNNVIDIQNAAPVVAAPGQSWTALAFNILCLVDLQSISNFLTMRHYAHAATRHVHAQQAARNTIPRLADRAANNKPVVPRRWWKPAHGT